MESFVVNPKSFLVRRFGLQPEYQLSELLEYLGIKHGYLEIALPHTGDECRETSRGRLVRPYTIQRYCETSEFFPNPTNGYRFAEPFDALLFLASALPFGDREQARLCWVTFFQNLGKLYAMTVVGNVRDALMISTKHAKLTDTWTPTQSCGPKLLVVPE